MSKLNTCWTSVDMSKEFRFSTKMVRETQDWLRLYMMSFALIRVRLNRHAMVSLRTLFSNSRYSPHSCRVVYIFNQITILQIPNRRNAEVNMEGQFLVRQIYEDEITYNLIGAAVEVLSKFFCFSSFSFSSIFHSAWNIIFEHRLKTSEIAVKYDE